LLEDLGDMSKPPEIFNAEKFERKMQKSEDKKVIDLKNSREIFYIWRIFKIICVLVLIGLMGYFFYPFFIFTPIYRNDSCFKLRYGNTDHFNKWNIKPDD
jgi:hypothetical protein